jgi:hypothetical protein
MSFVYKEMNSKHLTRKKRGVKFALEEAMNAQRGSRGIALLFL